MDVLHSLTLADVLREHGRSRPKVEALVCEDDRHTYAAFDERVGRLANLLAESGVGAGDRVSWLAQNCHRLLEGLLACARLGAVFHPANWRASAHSLGSPGQADPEPEYGVGVVINELLAHTDPPWEDAIELYNPTPQVIDLALCTSQTG